MSGFATSLAAATTLSAFGSASGQAVWTGLASLDFAFQALAEDHVGCAALSDTLAAAVVGAIKARQHPLKILVAVEGDARHRPLLPPVEALHHAIGLWRAGPGFARLDTLPLAGALEAIYPEAGAAVGQHVRDAERQGRRRLVEEEGGAVDGDVEVALTRVLGRPQPVEPFGLEDAVDSIPV